MLKRYEAAPRSVDHYAESVSKDSHHERGDENLESPRGGLGEETKKKRDNFSNA